MTLVCWLVVFNVPSTARSYRDGTPIFCPLRRTWSSINTPFPPGIEPPAVAYATVHYVIATRAPWGPEFISCYLSNSYFVQLNQFFGTYVLLLIVSIQFCMSVKSLFLKQSRKLLFALSLFNCCGLYPVYMGQTYLDHNLDQNLDWEILSRVNTWSGLRSG